MVAKREGGKGRQGAEMMRFVCIKKQPPRGKTGLTSMADLGSRETRKTQTGETSSWQAEQPSC